MLQDHLLQPVVNTFVNVLHVQRREFGWRSQIDAWEPTVQPPDWRGLGILRADRDRTHDAILHTIPLFPGQQIRQIDFDVDGMKFQLVPSWNQSAPTRARLFCVEPAMYGPLHYVGTLSTRDGDDGGFRFRLAPELIVEACDAPVAPYFGDEFEAANGATLIEELLRLPEVRATLGDVACYPRVQVAWLAYILRVLRRAVRSRLRMPDLAPARAAALVQAIGAMAMLLPRSAEDSDEE